MRELAQTRVRFGYRRLRVLLHPRRLGRRQRALLSGVYRGRPGVAAETPVAARHGRAPRAATSGDGSQRHLEHGFRRRRVRRWSTIPDADGVGSVHTRMLGDRRRARADRPGRGRRRSSACGSSGGCRSGSTATTAREFVSAAMDLWAYTNSVILDFSRRGKPTDNAGDRIVQRPVPR